MPAESANPSPHAPPARAVAVLVALAGLMLAGGALYIHFGAVRVPFADVWAALLGRLDEDAPNARIVNLVRMPRLIVAALAGMGLGASGAVLQSVMRNPLAAPNIVGVTAGAGLCATLALVVGGAAWLLAPAAFAGAMAAGLLVYALSWQPGVGTSPVRMILAGVAVGAVFTAMTTMLMLMNPGRTPEVVQWMAGTLNDATWAKARLATPYVVVGVLGALALARPLNVLQLGDDAARSLGMRVELVRFLAMGAACLLAAASVSVAGLIGFVGLIVPQLAQALVGSNRFALIPTSAAGGAVLLIWADLGSRALFDEVVPVGVLTALLGGPYFIFLLYRTRLLG